MGRISQIKVFLVSNMYPEEGKSQYGIFVKNIENSLIMQGVSISAKSVIIGRSNHIFKLFKYWRFYINSFKNAILADYNIVYVHFLLHALPVIVFTKVFKKRKPIFVNIHGSDLLGFQSFFFNRFKKIGLNLSDKIVIPSDFFIDILTNNYKISREKIFVYPSGGINTEVFFPSKSQNKKEYTVGFVSRISKKKGWKTLLDASLILQKKYRLPIKIRLAGDGEDKEQLIQFINENKLEKQVIFEGELEHNGLASFYKKLSIFIFPTEYEESLGLVGLEAMACGIPVIGSKIGGLKTYIEDNVNGFLFTPGDSQELAKKIKIHFELDANEKVKMKENAKKTAQLFNSKKVVVSLINEFSSHIYRI